MSELNYHTTKFFSEHLITLEMKKNEILMIKPVFLGLSILELSKILLYEFWYNYVNPTFDEEENLCYRDTDLLYT